MKLENDEGEAVEDLADDLALALAAVAADLDMKTS